MAAGGRTSLEAVERFSAAHAARGPTPRRGRTTVTNHNPKYFIKLLTFALTPTPRLYGDLTSTPFKLTGEHGSGFDAATEPRCSLL